MRILYIEDEIIIQQQVKEQLEIAGYTVDVSAEGHEGYYLASEYPYDLAVIDIGLPGLSGLEIIQRLRKAGNKLPVLLLTARGRWQDRVEGLDAGADDYLVKPFQIEELLARIKALLRRSATDGLNEFRCDVLRIDMDAQKVYVQDILVELTAFEYRLLEYLIRKKGKVLSKGELADYLYPHDDDRDSNVIEVMIGRLRRKIDPHSKWKPIETLRGRGYRFTAKQI